MALSFGANARVAQASLRACFVGSGSAKRL